MSGSADPNRDLSKEEADRLEREHFAKVCRSFRFYKQYSLERVMRAERSFKRLPQRHQDMLGDFAHRMKDHTEAIEQNFGLMLEIIEDCPMWDQAEEDAHASKERPLDFDMDKVLTTVKQMVRDWAAEGKPERDICYQPIIDKVEELFKGREPNTVSVCVPGCGLGRLCFEFARRGYTSQGNEWSVHMLLASNYILNKYPGTFHTILHPWAHIFCNNYRRGDQLRAVCIPDVDTHEIPPGTDFSMCAGDFLEVYTEEDKWDCVTTCFFIDTARNVCAYIEQLYKMIKPGGYWINFGPLLYHFDDNRDGPSLEISFEEVKEVMVKVGFKIIEERFPIQCGYISNPNSMMQTVYNCVFIVAQK